MKEIRISASPKQLSRLRKGHKVRVKNAMEGSGFNLVVEPSKYDTISRSFAKGKGSEVSLSLEEIEANKMTGEGIFGKKFDKFLGKAGIKKEVYALGDVLKNPVKKAIRTIAKNAPNASAAAAAALATAVGQPQLAGIAGIAGKKLGEKAGKYLEKNAVGYIDNPEAYQKNPKKMLLGSGLRQMAALESAKQNKMTADLGAGQFTGEGLYAAARGRGLYAGGGMGRGLQKQSYSWTQGIVGLDGDILPPSHPAMKSQPYASDFHQQYQLPKPFQQYHSGK
jgi:hypothetical protein